MGFQATNSSLFTNSKNKGLDPLFFFLIEHCRLVLREVPENV